MSAVSVQWAPCNQLAVINDSPQSYQEVLEVGVYTRYSKLSNRIPPMLTYSFSGP